jgi:hypothetical protein
MRLDLAEGHEVAPVQRITLRPRGGLPMRLTQRARRGTPLETAMKAEMET